MLFSARTLGSTAGVGGWGAGAAWAGSAPLSTSISFLSLSNWIFSPKIKFTDLLRIDFCWTLCPYYGFEGVPSIDVQVESSRSWRCWRRSSLPCSIRTVLEKLLVIFVENPRNKLPTDWPKNRGLKWYNYRKSTTLLKDQATHQRDWPPSINMKVKVMVMVPE